MISNGMTGTARHGTCPNSAKLRAREHIRSLRAAGRQNCLARAAHVRRVRIVADRLQREIRFDTRGNLERAIVKQRPAAMRRPECRANSGRFSPAAADRYDRENVPADTYSAGIVASASSSNTQCPSSCLPLRQRLRRGRDRVVEPARDGSPAISGYASRPTVARKVDAMASRQSASAAICSCAVRAAICGLSISFAAVTPDRTAPSIVPGSRVSVQSPASTKFARSVSAPGRRSSWATLATIVARRSLTTRNGGRSACRPPQIESLHDVAPDRGRRGRPPAGRSACSPH